jgi:hypothetical protein
MLKQVCGKFYPSVHELYEPIREYCYSLLLGMKRNYELNFGCTITESCIVLVHEIMLDLDSNERVVKELRIKPKEKLSISLLWDTSKNKKFRLSYFLESVCCASMFKDIYEKLVPIEYTVACMVLRFMLIRTSFLIVEDVHVFVKTFITVQKGLNIPTTLDGSINSNITAEKRIVHLASLFVHGMKTFSFANDTCGGAMSRRKSFNLRSLFDLDTFRTFYYEVGSTPMYNANLIVS